MMEQMYAAIVTAILTFLGGLLVQNLQPKAKLAYWFPHAFLFSLKKENISLQTNSITIQNLGRNHATEIEIIHSVEPDFYQISPAINFSHQTLDNGNHVIKIPFLGAKEFITLQLLSYKTLPSILSIRSKESIASEIPISIQRVFLNGLILLLLICYWWEP